MMDRMKFRPSPETIGQVRSNPIAAPAETSLAGAMAHEFNNILTTILGYAEMLAETLPAQTAALDYAEQVVESGRRAERIVEQVLLISRRGRFMSKPFDVLDAVSEMLPALYTSVSQTTRLDIELSDEPMIMLGTPRDLEHLLVNLCRNASEAQDGCGSVLLKITTIEQPAGRQLSHGVLDAGAFLQITVTDVGPGIREGDNQRIFEPFFTTGGDKRRIGLGLSVVDATTRALNGQIDVTSTADGGACFTLFFPRL